MKSRPMSATTASSFGNFKQSKNLEMNPKVSNYQSNGSGRDSYIKMGNGGFTKTAENNNFRIIHTRKKK